MSILRCSEHNGCDVERVREREGEGRREGRREEREREGRKEGGRERRGKRGGREEKELQTERLLQVSWSGTILTGRQRVG